MTYPIVSLKHSANTLAVFFQKDHRLLQLTDGLDDFLSSAILGLCPLNKTIAPNVVLPSSDWLANAAAMKSLTPRYENAFSGRSYPHDLSCHSAVSLNLSL